MIRTHSVLLNFARGPCFAEAELAMAQRAKSRHIFVSAMRARQSITAYLQHHDARALAHNKPVSAVVVSPTQQISYIITHTTLKPAGWKASLMLVCRKALGV